MINKDLAKKAFECICPDGMIDGFCRTKSFVDVCSYLSEDQENLMSWKGRNKPSVYDEEGLKVLAKKYLAGYKKSDFPAVPGTVPDELVSLVMQEAYGYSEEDCEKIKKEHQDSMCAENCIGALLERYLDRCLHDSGWVWCCGEFVKAVDFIKPVVVSGEETREWLALQIKNRDNSENSSSKDVRKGTKIDKWFRGFSVKGGTNWDNLPATMQGKGLSEAGFQAFVKEYLQADLSAAIENLEEIAEGHRKTAQKAEEAKVNAEGRLNTAREKADGAKVATAKKTVTTKTNTIAKEEARLVIVERYLEILYERKSQLAGLLQLE